MENDVFLWTKKSLGLGQATIISNKLMDSFGTVLLHPINIPPITVCVFTGRFSQQGDNIFWVIVNIRKTFKIKNPINIFVLRKLKQWTHGIQVLQDCLLVWCKDLYVCLFSFLQKPIYFYLWSNTSESLYLLQEALLHFCSAFSLFLHLRFSFLCINIHLPSNIVFCFFLVFPYPLTFSIMQYKKSNKKVLHSSLCIDSLRQAILCFCK